MLENKKKSKINNISSYFRDLEKEQFKPGKSKRRNNKIIEVNEIEK